MQKYKLKRLFLLLLFPLNSLIIFYAKRHPDIIERVYSQGIYPIISSAINILTGFVKFSIAEIIIILVLLGLLFYITITIVKISQSDKGKRTQALYVMFVNILIMIAVAGLLFNLMAGLNYYRKPFMEVSGIRVNVEEEIPPATTEEIYQLAKDLSVELEYISDNVKRDENGNMVLRYKQMNTNMIISQQVMSDFGEKYPILRGVYAQPKTLAFSKVFSKFGVKGFIFPYTYEANVNVDVPDHELPAIMIHESAHTRGFMFEDEASFISYLACIESKNYDFQYSGTMLALSYTLEVLHSHNETYYREIVDSLPENVKKDFILSSEYWGTNKGMLQTVGNDLNDTYLKANNQEDGLDSYIAVVELLVEYNR